MSERMWRVSPKRYSPVTAPGLVGTVLTHDDVGELPGGDRLATADVEDPPAGAVVRQHEHVRVHDVVDIDVVADRRAILVEGRRYALQVAQAEDAARTRVRVVDRLPRALHDAVAQGDGRDAVPAAQVDGDHLLAELRHAVGVLRIGDPLGRRLHLKRTAALRARDVPLTRREGLLGTHSRVAARRRPGTGRALRPSPTATTPPRHGQGRGARQR